MDVMVIMTFIPYLSSVLVGRNPFNMVFPACLLAGTHFLERQDKSWIPERVRDDQRNTSGSIIAAGMIDISYLPHRDMGNV